MHSESRVSLALLLVLAVAATLGGAAFVLAAGQPRFLLAVALGMLGGGLGSLAWQRAASLAARCQARPSGRAELRLVDVPAAPPEPRPATWTGAAERGPARDGPTPAPPAAESPPPAPWPVRQPPSAGAPRPLPPATPFEASTPAEPLPLRPASATDTPARPSRATPSSEPAAHAPEPPASVPPAATMRPATERHPPAPPAADDAVAAPLPGPAADRSAEDRLQELAARQRSSTSELRRSIRDVIERLEEEEAPPPPRRARRRKS